ncbi:C2H2 type zinc finger domain-containing protein [Colletotrichum truncatum]|uniref:C2H2 type zinc finger domain-containing protein n=1 Tax=Colletotrichum truncatum TaxID=5467 RepID=A0ACC3ZCD8_COLTU|nr:C2H2 type zinc finger domain-containing protein [Colletotrichum truncatum]KAF6797720.1 C2H2 type zinc finger domain-containing protein [Colletotrichum truncatum]
MASVDVAALGSGGATATSHPYTCNTCAVAYRNIDLQRGHMKSDWHRYNLKRRVASLPPITSEIFNEKVLQARAVQSAEAEKAMFERTCEACQKSYSSENAFQNHLTSQKHKVRVASLARRKGPVADDASSVMSSTFSLGEPISIEKEAELDSEAEEEFIAVVEGLKKTNIEESKDERPSPVKRPSNPHLSAQGQRAGDDASINRESDSTTPVPSKPEIAWTIKSCLFCNYESPSVTLNASHMERFHDMFIPEKQYLVDLEGLLQHLQERIHEGHQCLYCFKTKKTAFAVQTHMRDKGHCKIPYDTEEVQLDIGDFYDFRSTYSDDGESDDEEEVDQNGGAKLGLKRPTKLFGEDGEEVDGAAEDGWETDSDASSLDSDELTAFTADGRYEQYERLDKHPHHSRDDPRAHHQADGWHSHAHKHTRAVFYDDYELHLPSGKSVGHRAHNRYFRQNLHNYPTPEERAERLAIEAGSGDEMDVDGMELTTTGNPRSRNSRAIARRDAAGMAGVTDNQKRVAKEEATRGRSAATRHEKRYNYKVSEKLNNQKNFYYRYQAGG